MRIGTNIGRRAAVAMAAVGLVMVGCAAEPKGAGAPGAGTSGKVVRINAGSAKAITDAEGNLWLADTGFVGGDVVDRGNIAIGNTNNPAIYRTEHWGMSEFAYAVPNGKYVVKLHFAETFEEITAKGGRVFSLDVGGTAIKNLDVFAEAGGARKALVKSVPVEVTGGKLVIKFLEGEQASEINGVEIVPQ
jgi:endoglucanase